MRVSLAMGYMEPETAISYNEIRLSMEGFELTPSHITFPLLTRYAGVIPYSLPDVLDAFLLTKRILK